MITKTFNPIRNFITLTCVAASLSSSLFAQTITKKEVEKQAAAGEAPELTEAADRAIDRGLKYLLSTQKADGSWSKEDGTFSTAGTSLGLMAFMVLSKGKQKRHNQNETPF